MLPWFFTNRFPFTDFNKVNLDFILRTLKQITSVIVPKDFSTELEFNGSVTPTRVTAISFCGLVLVSFYVSITSTISTPNPVLFSVPDDKAADVDTDSVVVHSTDGAVVCATSVNNVYLDTLAGASVGTVKGSMFWKIAT